MAYPRKPAMLHLIEGTYRPDRHGPKKRAKPKKPPDELGPPPAELDAAEQAVWKEVAELAPWLRHAERHSVEVYARLLARFRSDPAGLGGRPLALLLATARGLGLVWSDRQRHRPDAVVAEPDLLDELLG